MKTTFSRLAVTAVCILLSAMLLVGLGFQILTDHYLRDNMLSRLERVAGVVSAVPGSDLTPVARAAGADVLICDREGRVLRCSDLPDNCPHLGKTVQKRYRSSGTDVGVIRELYADPRFFARLTAQDSGRTVIVSAPVLENRTVLHGLLNLYLLVAGAVMLAGVLVATFLSRRQSDPIRQVARAARKFGQGDLNTRVQVHPRSPQEVQELATAFNHMADSLQAGQKRQRAFIANVSHELKTPMTTISGYLDGMLDGTIPQEEHTRYMALVAEETRRLNRLVRSMLDISRAQGQETIPESMKKQFDVCECVGLVMITMERAIEQKGLQVETEIPDHPVYTRAAQDPITQVVYNLLDNAVKFSRSLLGVQIRETGKKITVSVYNDGETIPPEELPLVFERFHKLDASRSRNPEGWGLGLAIVKTIVESHGEQVSVTSENGRTVFTFTLPVSAE